MAEWLVKSEPEVYSIADLARDQTTGWEGVRNFQARNYLRAMKVGDRVLFYHSNAQPSGVAGTATVTQTAFPDPTQFEAGNDAADPTSNPDDPRWSSVTLRFATCFARFVDLATLKADPALVGLEVTRKGSRLSVHPVSAAHFSHICRLGGGPG